MFRLGVERLDLVQFAWWDYGIPRYLETAAWLSELRDAGKIRHLDVTNFDSAHLQELLDAGMPIVSHQLQYSLLDSRPAGAMVDLCRRAGVALLCYGTLAGGFLRERYLGAGEPREPFPNRSLIKYRLIIDEFGGWSRFQDLLQVLNAIACKHRTRIPAVAVRTVLDWPGVAATIVGAADSVHAPSNLKVLELTFDDDDRHALASLTRTGVQGSVYDLERDLKGPHAAIMRYDLNVETGQ